MLNLYKIEINEVNHLVERLLYLIAKEMNVPKETVVLALEAIVEPVSLYEPVFSDGDDTIYVMDQISDSKNSDDSWLEDILIKEAMKKQNGHDNPSPETVVSSKKGDFNTPP